MGNTGRIVLGTVPVRLLAAGGLLLAAAAAALAQETAPPHDPRAAVPVDCLDCHRIFNGWPMPRGVVQEVVCRTCHNPTGKAKDLPNSFAMHVDPLGGARAVDCGSCHDAHAPSTAPGRTAANLRLLRADPTKYVAAALPSLAYTEAGTFVAGSAPFDGVCQTCHTGTGHYTNSSPDTHGGGGNCLQCHAHSRGFLPDGGKCSACHDTVRGTAPLTRRAVLAEFGAGYASAHPYDGSVDDSDCTVCHDQADHRGGSVAIRKFGTADSVRLSDHADPATSPSEADKLAEACLACHADGVTAPFGPGTPDPRPVDAGTSGWAGSTHRAKSVTCFGDGAVGCHASGHGSKKIELLAPFGTAATSPAYAEDEEGFCISCHRSGGAASGSDIGSEVAKASAHRASSYQRKHAPGETPDGKRDHVECTDCHDPHIANGDAAASAGAVSGRLKGVPGLDATGSAVAGASMEYEVCIRCHADDNETGSGRTSRVVPNANKRKAFDTANASFHPVFGKGKNADVPSLRSGWSKDSTMGCTDCHANDEGPGAGGTKPAGPHGSAWPALLERKYAKTDNTTESAANYALCYKCHDRTNASGNGILDDRSFQEHSKHVVGEKTPCNVCHDPHGVNSTSSTNSSHLVNFDTGVVSANSKGLRRFVDAGKWAGSCDLKCHGKDHDNWNY